MIRRLSIRNKVALALWGAALLAFAAASVAVTLYERLTLERRARQIMEPYAQLVSVGAEAAVAFEDNERAREILDTLRANPQISQAEIVLGDGSLLAAYGRSSKAAFQPHALKPDGVYVNNTNAEMIQSLQSGAHLHLVMSLEQLNRQTHDFLRVFATAALLLLVLITLGLMAALQRTIVRPISTLAEAVEQVRTQAAYHQRMAASGSDEVAQLGRSFNAMMGAIQERDNDLQRVNRELRAISNCNQTLLRATDEQPLIAELCRIICEEAGYRMAWVGYAEQDEAKTVRPVAWAGVEEGYLENAKTTWADTERGRGPIGTAIRTQKSAYVQDFIVDPNTAPWRQDAQQRDYRSCISLPLQDENKGVFGALTIYSSQENAFTATEIRLLEELAGDLAFGIAVLRGRGERMRAENEIRKLNVELEERVRQRTAQMEVANKELESFSYSVSHDLRAPLRHINGFAGILRMDYADQLCPDAHNCVEKIQQGAKRMGEMVDDLLNLSRCGRGGLHLTPTDLSRLVEETRDLLKPECQGRAIEWQIGPLPTLDCDRTLVLNVFQNLLTNAIKFTRKRTPAVIQVGQAEYKGHAAIFVRDNGAGFDMKYVDKLFGVFQRLHRAEEFEGTGVGLATVRRIVRKHGGDIWAEAEVDKGATFYFTLS